MQDRLVELAADLSCDKKRAASALPVSGLGVAMYKESKGQAAVGPDPRAWFVIGIDVGGTNLKMGISDSGGTFVLKKTVPSAEMGTGDAAVAGLAGLASRMIEKSPIPPGCIRGVGLVVPGVTDPENGIVSLAPAFGWKDLPIRDMLSHALGLPVQVENDVNAAALAEKEWGVGRDLQDFVFLNIGTGIGAGLILNGQLYRGHLHAAGEVGYAIVDLGWARDEKRRRGSAFGCLESLAGALGVVRRAEELGGVGLWRNGQAGHTAEDVFMAARKGDPVAAKVLEEVTDYLAVGIINIAVVVSPEAVVLGGGVARAGETLLAPLRAKVGAWSPIRPRILRSSLHEETGLVGAASLATCYVRQTASINDHY